MGRKVAAENTLTPSPLDQAFEDTLSLVVHTLQSLRTQLRSGGSCDRLVPGQFFPPRLNQPTKRIDGGTLVGLGCLDSLHGRLNGPGDDGLHELSPITEMCVDGRA